MVDDDADSDSPTAAGDQEYSSDVVAMPLPKDVAGDLHKAHPYLLLNQKTGCVHIASPAESSIADGITHVREKIRGRFPMLRQQCAAWFASPDQLLHCFMAGLMGQAIIRPSGARTHALIESEFCGGSNFGAHLCDAALYNSVLFA